MTIALVGAVGAVSTGTSGQAVPVAWGTGANRTAGNLLLLHVAVTGSATLPAAPSGWFVGITRAGTTCSAAVFYRYAAGADAAPTVAAITSGIINARLSEFSGPGLSLDQTSVASGITSPQKATHAAADPTVGVLLASAVALIVSGNKSLALDTATYTNATATSTSNSASNTASHYNFGYGLSTANTVPDADAQAFTTTNVTGTAVVLATFRQRIGGSVGAVTTSSAGAGVKNGLGGSVGSLTTRSRPGPGARAAGAATAPPSPPAVSGPGARSVPPGRSVPAPPGRPVRAINAMPGPASDRSPRPGWARGARSSPAGRSPPPPPPTRSGLDARTGWVAARPLPPHSWSEPGPRAAGAAASP